MTADVRRAAPRAHRRRAGELLAPSRVARRSRRGRARARRRGGRRSVGRLVRRWRDLVRLGASGGGRAGSARRERSSSAGDGTELRSGPAAAKERTETETAGEEREQALHEPDATLPQLLATPVAPSPEAAQGGGADSVHEKENSGVNEYEIMLLLDPELAEERANEIIQRIRDAVEGAGGHLGRPRAVGPPPAGLRDRPQERGRLPPAALHLPGRDARRDHARPQDHGRRHAPRRVPARPGLATHEGAGADSGRGAPALGLGRCRR